MDKYDERQITLATAWVITRVIGDAIEEVGVFPAKEKGEEYAKGWRDACLFLRGRVDELSSAFRRGIEDEQVES